MVSKPNRQDKIDSFYEEDSFTLRQQLTSVYMGKDEMFNTWLSIKRQSRMTENNPAQIIIRRKHEYENSLRMTRNDIS